MNFEYDKTKSSINKSKHNIDFKEAQKLWDDPYSFELPSEQSADEERFLVLGKIDSKNYTAIITYRDTNIRIMKRRLNCMKASELDKKFDDNQEDILDYFDRSKIKMINEEPKRVNIDFPLWMVQSLDREAKHVGVSRQAVIKMWLAEKLQSLNSTAETI